MVKLSCDEIINRSYINKSDLKDSIDTIMELFNQDHPIGQAYFGLCYYHRIGVEQDITKAVELYKLSAAQNNPLGQALLGACYYNNKNIEQNKLKAIELFKLAVEQNLSLGQAYLGVCYEYGDGVEKDVDKAVELYKLSAEQNHILGQTYLGLCYEKGRGVEKDVAKAIELYKNAYSICKSRFMYIKPKLPYYDKKQLSQLEEIAKIHKEFNHIKIIRMHLKKFIKSPQYKKLASFLITDYKDCPICFEKISMEEFSMEEFSMDDSSIERVYITKCFHIYHANCVKTLDKCPLCREELIEVDL